MSIPVEIVNPRNGSRWTSAKSANRLVARGRAVWVVPVRRIDLDETHHAVASAAAEQALKRVLGYDRIRRMLTRQELRNIPVAQIDKFLAKGA